MADYGSTIEPGIVTNVSSASTISTDGASRSDVGFVGQADLGGGVGEGSADPNTVYEVTRSGDARDWFGEDSLLTNTILDALDEGAFPVYGVATAETSVTGEDLSGLSSTSGSFANAPVDEDASSVSFTIDGTSKTASVVYDDPSTYTPDTDEVVYNPTTGAFELDAAPSDADDTNDTVDYEYHDYSAANQAMVDDASEVVDFFVPINENLGAKTDAQAKVQTMAGEHNFALLIVGAASSISETAAYSNDFDDSRVQSVYPTRDADGNSTLGAYAGKRASLGISTTPINKRLYSLGDLSESLGKDKRGELIENYVVPLAQESGGARVADDVNTVSDDNTEEANIRYGFSRLVIDYALKTVHENETPFIGRLNAPAVRASLEGLLNSELKPLKRSNAVLDYDVSVRKIDATTASVQLGVETAKPLRFIENEIAIGGVQ